MTSASRRALGAYYTPEAVVARGLAALAHPGAGARVVDLACGDGIWLERARARWPGVQVVGIDVDPETAEAARSRLGAHAEVRVGDGLATEVLADLVVGNPPWGLGRAARVRRGQESATRFVARALDLLAPGGRLCLVLPAAWLEVAAHRPARERLLAEAAIERVERLGDVFPGVFAPAALLVARKEPDAAARDAQWVTTPVGQVAQAAWARDPARAFNARLSAADHALLERLESGAQRLCGRATFILGVVTGDNRATLVETGEGEPIVAGPDVSPFAIRAPSRRLCVPLDDVQQAAPRAAYARRKVIYRFISSHPVAAVDEQGLLTLNSANALAVDDPALDPYFVAAALNSTAARFAHGARYALLRILRSHLEQLPLPGGPASEQRAIARLARREGARAAAELDDRVLALYGLSAAERTQVRDACLRS